MAVIEYYDSQFTGQQIDAGIETALEIFNSRGFGDVGDAIVKTANGWTLKKMEVEVDSAISSTSTNPVQNKAVRQALQEKVDKIFGKGLSENDYTNAEKRKLSDAVRDIEELGEGISGVSEIVGNIAENLTRTMNTVSGLNEEMEEVENDISNLGTSVQNIATNLNRTNSEVEGLKASKQDVLTFDTDPISGSENPVTSSGIKGALNTLDYAKADNLFYDEGTHLLYLVSNGEIISDGIEIKGGGGGGGGSTYTVTLTSLMPSRTISISEGMPVVISMNYTSVDSEGAGDGAGSGKVIVNGVDKKTFSVPQGESSVDITSTLSLGSNNVRIRVENSEGSNRTLTYSVTVMALSISSTLPEMDIYNGDVDFYYTVVGTGEKTVHFVLDGEEIGQQIIQTSGRSNTYTIEAPNNGPHIFECYASVENQGLEINSNVLTFGMIWDDGTSADPYIVSTYDVDSCIEGSTQTIRYLVYDPTASVAEVTLQVVLEGGQIYSSQNISVDRSIHTWTLSDYPSGNTIFRIICRNRIFEKEVEVTPYELPISVVTDRLELEFKPAGRSNYEADPAQWSYGDYVGEFEGFGWNSADGWLTDENYAPILRFIPNDYLYIPIMPFATDARSTGYTIECELATRDVRNYDSVVIDCMSNGRGFKIASQQAGLNSEQSTISIQFKEDSKVRITFVVEQSAQNRLVYVYINAVMCGVIQYPINDDFSQATPVGFTIGAESCGLDLYSVRCYKKALTRREQLDNFICDKPSLEQRIAGYENNDILNVQEEIVADKLPITLPYMIINASRLPEFKGDKIKNCHVSFVDKVNTNKSFEASNVTMDVQGTSSAGYPVKNLKLKYEGGFEIDGEHRDGYSIFSNSIPANVFTMKTDYASSEGANNVELVMLYEENDPYKDPPQVIDPRVRKGIQGRPCVIFWKNSATNEVKFIGKYNFNNDKDPPEVFGFTDEYPAAECWEFLNNTSNRTLFKSADFSGTAWQNDFEARYPDGYLNINKFAAMASWVVEHNRENASTDEEKAEMLADFKAHFEEHFIKDAMLFYYIFTEVFLMVDSRAKNMFLTTFDGTHWFPIQYDMDTALGINNEGVLSFTYSLEDTDTIGGDKVFNGQDSVLWCNIRDAYADEIAEMYKGLRTKENTNFAYAPVRDRFNEHQDVWPEALWNEDSYIKYIDNFITGSGSYLSMLQGSKESQRDWWLFNAFRYRDSKYQTGDANTEFVTLRCYGMGDISLTPYSDIYARIKYGSYTVTQRAFRNVSVTLLNPIDTMSDTEVYIYSADRIANIGDLSALKIGFADFAMATKLQSLILGSDADGYTNERMTELHVGNNQLLTVLDVSNCTNLAQTIDLSGCYGLETVKAGGTSIPSINLPNGGHIETLILPETITNLTIQNQKDLETIDIAGYGSLTTLRIENTTSIPYEEIINGATNLNRVRLIGIDWYSEDEENLQSAIDKLETCVGIDESGNNTPHAVVQGKIYVDNISGELLAEIQENFPEVVVVVGGVEIYLVRFMNYDGTELYKEAVTKGNDAEDPVEEEYIDAPSKPNTDTVHYVYDGWNGELTNITSNKVFTAKYAESYRVRFLNYDSTILQTSFVQNGETAEYTGETPTKPSTAQYDYTFNGWSGSGPVTAPVDYVAQFTSSVRYYTVRFINGNAILQTDSVAYGGSTSYRGATPTYYDPTQADDYDFAGWNKDTSSITGDTDAYAVWMYNKSITRAILNKTVTAIDNSEVSNICYYAFFSQRSLQSVSFPSCS